LESGKITISRAARQADFPAQFQFVAAMNPCPCGYLGEESGRCHCTADRVNRYRQKISGPLLDRIDLHIHVARVPRQQLLNPQSEDEPGSAQLRELVTTARQNAITRGHVSNAQLTAAQVREHCQTSDSAQRVIEQAMDKLNLSARAYHRSLKVARSIADMEDSDVIESRHISEALGYRQLSLNA